MLMTPFSSLGERRYLNWIDNTLLIHSWFRTRIQGQYVPLRITWFNPLGPGSVYMHMSLQTAQSSWIRPLWQTIILFSIVIQDLLCHIRLVVNHGKRAWHSRNYYVMSGIRPRVDVIVIDGISFLL
jgi:hypothetical protein